MANNQGMDQKIYEQLMAMEREQPKEEGKQEEEEDQSKVGGPVFMLHLLMKVIPIVFIILKNFLSRIISKTIVIELILIFVVIDFWCTKNITGRHMTGLRWAFEEDQYGIERLRFEGRVNEEKVNSLSSKLFWFILGIYTLIPVFYLISTILFSNTMGRFRFDDFLLYLTVVIAGGANFFFFWKARSGVSDRREELRTKLGGDFKKKLGNASVVSFL